MKNEKRRKAEKIQDKLEPEKALARNLARVVDRLDEHADIQLRLTALLEGTKSLKVENLDEVKIPSSFIISNLKDIPFPEWQLPDIFSVKIGEKPEWYKEPQPFPEFPKFPEKIAIDWEHAPQPKQEQPAWITTLFAQFFELLASLLTKIASKVRSVKLERGEIGKPQFFIQLDPATGKPIGKQEIIVQGGNLGGSGFVKNQSGAIINPSTQETLASVLTELLQKTEPTDRQRVTEYGTAGLPNFYNNIAGVYELPTTVIADPTAALITAVSGDVVATGAKNGLQITGNIAHNSADDVNSKPIKLGGMAKSSFPQAVADGNRVNGYFDQNGRLTVNALRRAKLLTQEITAAGNTTLVAAQGAGNNIIVTHISAYNKADAVALKFTDGAGGGALHQIYLSADKGLGVNATSENFAPLYILGGANTAFVVNVTGTTPNVFINIKYLVNTGEL